MSKPQVSIIILTKNQKRFIERSLLLIFSQTFKDFEVIIVDSGSTDGSIGVMEGYQVKILKLKMKPFNYAKAFNFGASKANGDYLVRLSGDAIPANQYWLENLLKGLGSKKVVGAHSRYLFSIFSDFLYQIWFRESFKFIRSGNPVSFGGASCVVKKEAWKKYPFNEKWGPGEDWEWGEIMKQAGYQILYQNNSLVFHEHRSPLPIQIKNFLDWLFVSSRRRIKSITY